MQFFGYGSLMNEGSLLQSFPEAKIVKAGTLSGYKRIFDFKSPYRKNPQTGIYSSVLNITEDPHYKIDGLILSIPSESYERLYEREAGYKQIKVELVEGEEVAVFMSTDHQPYSYIFNDPVQTEYLELCTQAAAQHGFLNNFLESTFLETESDKTLKELFPAL